MTTPDHASARLCAQHIVNLRTKYAHEGHRDTYAHGEHNLALAYLALTALPLAGPQGGGGAGSITDAHWERIANLARVIRRATAEDTGAEAPWVVVHPDDAEALEACLAAEGSPCRTAGGGAG